MFDQRHIKLRAWHAYLSSEPILLPILDQAPQIAAGADPALVRVARTRLGHIAVVRLHGPDWSLVMTGGRPVPQHLLAVHDWHRHRNGIPSPLNLRDPHCLPQLQRMCEGIFSALETSPSIGEHHVR